MKKLLFLLLMLPAFAFGQADPTPSAPVAKSVTSYQQGDSTYIYQNGKWFHVINKAYYMAHTVQLTGNQEKFGTLTMDNMLLLKGNLKFLTTPTLTTTFTGNYVSRTDSLVGLDTVKRAAVANTITINGVTHSLNNPSFTIATGSGTVTLFSKTDSYGLNSTVTNSTTTPNYAPVLDTTLIGTHNYINNFGTKVYIAGLGYITASSTNTLTNKSISGATNSLSAIGNASLSNSTVTFNGQTVALGASGTITAAPSGTAGGDLTGTYPNPTVNTINSITKSYYDPTSSIQTQLNAKQATGNYITALTGDVTATGPGSVSATLATTAVTPGSYTATNLTVDSKGRITSAANGSVTLNNIAANYLTGDVWKKFGTVINPDLAADAYAVLEPTVIYEGSPQILTGTTGSVFKMWFTSFTSIYYAESLDGLSWTRSPTVQIAGHCRSSVLKVGSTYIMYTVSVASSYKNIDRYTSTDGITWTLANAAVITSGTSGTWNFTSIANSSVYFDGTTYQMLLEGSSVGTNPFTIGYYHSTDGITWTQYGSNPVIGNASTFNAGGPFLTKVGSTWYAWFHGGGSVGSLPTDLYFTTSTNLTTWTTPVLISERTQADEGVGTSTGQEADPTLCEVNGKTYLWYSADLNGGATFTALNPLHIKLLIANYTIANLVNTTQTDGSMFNVAQPAVYDELQSDQRYIYNAYNVNNNTAFQVGSILMKTDPGGFGWRIEDPTTTTNQTVVLPDLILLNKSGVTNSISGTSTNITMSAWGGYIFQNGSGSGLATLGTVSSAGSWSFPNITMGTTGTSNIDLTYNNIGGTFSQFGYIARNTTSATSSVQQWSPSFYLEAKGWDSGSASSKEFDMQNDLEPISQSGGGGSLVWKMQVNGAGYTNVMKLTNLGDLTYTGALNGQTAVLATITGINAKTTGTTALYTVPTGKTLVVTGYVVRCTAASAITQGPAADIGDSVIGAASVVSNQAMNALTGITNDFTFALTGMSHVIAAGSVLNFNINTASTGTSQTISCDLIGYLK